MLPNLGNLSLGGAPPSRVCCPPHHVSVGERYDRRQDAIENIDPRRKKGESWTESVFDSSSVADLNAQENERDPLNPEGNAHAIAEDDVSAFVAWASRSSLREVVELGELVGGLKSITDFHFIMHGLSREVAKLVEDYIDELALYVEFVVVNVGAPWYLHNTQELTHNLANANNDATRGIREFCDDPANTGVLFVVDHHGQQTLTTMRRAYSLVRQLTPEAINAIWEMSVTENVGDILQTGSSSL